ncbi:hypothetical protein D3C77_265610 [compost metagenome]
MAKDLNDHKTIDGFADLDLPPPKPRMGRPPKPEGALSDADRAKRYRDKRRAERDAERARLEAAKPTSSVIDLHTDLRGALVERGEV